MADVIDILPNQFDDREVRRKLRKLTQELDGLIAVDQSGEVVIDRQALKKLSKDADFFPPDLQDRMHEQTEKHLKDKGKISGNARRVRWTEAATYGAPIEPVSVDALRQMGLNPNITAADARKILKQNYPDIPDFWLDSDAKQISDPALNGFKHNRTVWDCVVAKIGWWAALMVFGVAGAFLIVGTATGPWGIPLAVWLIGVLGGGTAVYVMNCVLNPNL